MGKLLAMMQEKIDRKLIPMNNGNNLLNGIVRLAEFG